MNKSCFLLCILVLLVALVAAASARKTRELSDSELADILLEYLTEGDSAENGNKKKNEPRTGTKQSLELNSKQAILLQKIAIDELNRAREKCDKNPIIDLKLLSIDQQAVKGKLFLLNVEVLGEVFEIQIIERVGSVHRLSSQEQSWEDKYFIRKITNSHGQVVQPCKLRLTTDDKQSPKKLKVVADVNNNKTTSWMATLYDREFAFGAIPSTPSSDEVLAKYVESLSDQVTIPSSYDVRTDPAYAGCKTLISPRDQKSCGSCWAFATTNMLSARLCKQQKKFLDLANVDLSEQDLISCHVDPGCSGGNLYTANNAITEYGIRTELFAPYASQDPFNGGPSCQAFGDKKSAYYKTVPETDKYLITNAGNTIQDKVRIIQQEILKNGPVYATFEVYEDFSSYKGGIYSYQLGYLQGAHAVSIVGWGVEAGVPYWTVLNSWGSSWGESGYFRIKRGVDECRIESLDISVVQPAVPTFPCKNFGAGVSCKNGGERYKNPANGNCGCKCPPIASGTYCETCAPCQNGGTRKASSTLCTCTCPAGTFGELCDTIYKVSKVSCAADKSITISISLNGGAVQPTDTLVAAWGIDEPADPVTFPGVVAAKSQPCASGCSASAKTVTLTIPGNPWGYQSSQTYWLYVWKNLGTNEFGASRGYANAFKQIINRSMCGKTF